MEQLEDLSALPISALIAACSGMAEQQGARHLIANSVHKHADPLRHPASWLAVEVLSRDDALDVSGRG